MLALVWSALEIHGAPFFISTLEKYGGSYIRDRAVQFSSWAVQFKTAQPGLYLLIHLLSSFALVSNGFVEYLAKLGLALWFRDARGGDSASTSGEEQQSGDEISGSDDSQPLLEAFNQTTDGYGTGGTDRTS